MDLKKIELIHFYHKVTLILDYSMTLYLEN